MRNYVTVTGQLIACTPVMDLIILGMMMMMIICADGRRRISVRHRSVAEKLLGLGAVLPP